jgi:hypothetical protein
LHCTHADLTPNQSSRPPPLAAHAQRLAELARVGPRQHPLPGEGRDAASQRVGEVSGWLQLQLQL